MPNNTIYNGVASAQSVSYVNYGLTYNSNNKSIHSRDTAGNIVIESGSGLNSALIIECVDQQYTVESVTRVLNTAFNYYTFPVTSLDTTGSIDNFDIPEPIESDIIYARYKPLENYIIPSEATFTQIKMDEVAAGLSQHPTNIDKYYITSEIKNSGKDLRFRVKINHRYDGTSFSDNPSTVAFSIFKEGPDYPLDRLYKNQQYSGIGTDGRWSYMSPYEVWTTKFELVIPNSEFQIGDVFSIGANCGNAEQFRYHTINADQTYWSITDASKNVDEWNQI